MSEKQNIWSSFKSHMVTYPQMWGITCYVEHIFLAYEKHILYTCTFYKLTAVIGFGINIFIFIKIYKYKIYYAK